MNRRNRQLISRCIKEANRLNDLCNNMLFVSQIEGRQYKQAKEPFDLSDFLKNVVKDYETRYPRRFVDDIKPGFSVTGDRVMLHMAINNLLENALKYTPEDSRVAVTLFGRDNSIVLQVADNGAGIPDNEKKKIFNKFYRVGSEESRKTKGTGLGLYLANKIVLQHKGRIVVKDNTPSGSIFEICLPNT